MIQTPKIDQIKFLIPEVIDEVAIIAEPTIEGVTALDVIKDDVSDGGALPAIWDGRPAFRPTINTGDLIKGDDSTFDSATGNWTLGTGVSIVGGVLRFTGAGGGDSSISVVDAAADYEVVFTISGYVAGSVAPRLGGVLGTARNANGSYAETISSGGTGIFIFEDDATFEADITVVTVRLKDTWRIDAALTRLPLSPGVNFAMLVNHNFTEAYQSSLDRIVDFYAAATDALPSDPLESVKSITGRLGKDPAFLALDGLSGIVTVPDSDNLSFGNGIVDTPMSVVVWVYVGAAQNFPLIVKDTAANREWTFITDSTGKISFALRDESAGSRIGAKYDTALSTGLYRAVGTYDGMGLENGIRLYLNGVEVATIPDSDGGYTAMENKSAPVVIGQDFAAFAQGKVNRALVYNRELSPSEVLADFDGTEVPFADKWGDQTEILDNSDMEAVGGWVGLPGTTLVAQYDFAVDPDGTGTTARSGTHGFKALTNVISEGIISALSYSLTVGKRYRFGVWLFHTHASAKTITYGTQNAIGLIQTAGIVIPPNTWTLVSQEFICTDATATQFWWRSDEVFTTNWYQDEFSVRRVGVVLSLTPGGINETYLKWFDDSDNLLHGVISGGVDFWNNPNADNPGYTFQEFLPLSLKYLFARFNPDALTGESPDTLLGWLLWGRIYDIALVDDSGYSAALRWPGVTLGQSDAGVVLAERKYGSRPGWALTLFPQDQDEWDLTQEMLDKVGGSLHPFYVVFDYSNSGPVVWQVRLDGEVPFTYVTGEPNVNGIQINLIAEGA